MVDGLYRWHKIMEVRPTYSEWKAETLQVFEESSRKSQERAAANHNHPALLNSKDFYNMSTILSVRKFNTYTHMHIYIYTHNIHVQLYIHICTHTYRTHK